MPDTSRTADEGGLYRGQCGICGDTREVRITLAPEAGRAMNDGDREELPWCDECYRKVAAWADRPLEVSRRAAG